MEDLAGTAIAVDVGVEQQGLGRGELIGEV